MRMYAFTIGYYDSDLCKTINDEGYVAAESFSGAAARVIETCVKDEKNISYCYISACDEIDGVLFWDSITNPRELMEGDCKTD